jgi:uncharacterized protein YidB (DUF937 family)
MPCSQLTEPPGDHQEPFRWGRVQVVDLLEQALSDPAKPSLRAFAAEHAIPPSTLQYWVRRHHDLAAPDAVRDFFESPCGHQLLRRIVLAAHLHFQQSGACGIRPLLSFFEHSGLGPLLACSYGAHQALACDLQDLLVSYGQQQPRALAAGMPARKISTCEDETFHVGQTCLVAIEPCSNFILVECYQPRRDAATWDRVIDTALEGLPVTVIQVSSDEAKGIKAHVHGGLLAHHSPDLMHQQQDLHRATSLPLQAQVERAQAAVEEAYYQGLLVLAEETHWRNSGPHPGRPPDFAARLEPKKAQIRAAEAELSRCQQSQRQVKEAIRGLGDDYHPFDGKTAQAVQPEQLRQRLQGRLEVIQQAADQAGISDKAQGKISRVKKLLPRLVATLAWFWLQARQLQAEEGLGEQERRLFERKVLGWVYWQQASKRGRDARHRQQLRDLAQRAGEVVEADPLWKDMSEGPRQRMLALARECAGRWVRSSSCVEGRNGVLRLRHHGRQGLSQKALTALTVLHNYWLRRPDGTTAAERFFGRAPDDLFEWLLARFPELPRPAKPRREAA